MSLSPGTRVGVYDGESMVAILRQLSEQYLELGTSVVN